MIIMKRVVSIFICLVLLTTLALTTPVLSAEAMEVPEATGTSETPKASKAPEAPKAPKTTEAPQPVKVALIDSGISPIVIAATHIGEGKNYVLSDRDTADVLGHGTALAGLILDAAPDAVLVPLVYSTRIAGGKVIQCSVKTVAMIIRDAVDVYDCQVINISAGISRDVPELREAIAYAEEQGVVVVASVGNTNRTTPELRYYPACYDTVIGVGALRKDGKVASFSQRHGVSLAAPGDGLKVTGLKGQTTTVSGTSYATAHVTGAVAALLAKSPDLTPAQVRELLFDSAQDLGDG